MVDVIGLTGLVPIVASLTTTPPYDVIKPDSDLEKFLEKENNSLFHIILGNDPKATLDSFIANGILIEEKEPCLYVYEQKWDGQTRLGVFVAAKVDGGYDQGNIIRHEKTFDAKVQGRIKLGKETGHSFGPVFTITNNPFLKECLTGVDNSFMPTYEFTSEFGGFGDLHGIQNRVWRVAQNDALGHDIIQELSWNPLYIADGHHRYHTALVSGQTHFLAYVTPSEDANILAYNRVIKPVIDFESIKGELNLEKTDEFKTPDKHEFCIYTKDGIYLMRPEKIPTGVVSKLDVSILEKELYRPLGLTHDMVTDETHFDYYPESDLEEMKAQVDSGKYQLAVALAPVSPNELIAVADEGLKELQHVSPDKQTIVMPEKSTYFAPKILSGIIGYAHKIQQMELVGK